MNTATCWPPSTPVPAAAAPTARPTPRATPVARRASLLELGGAQRGPLLLHRPLWQRAWLALGERWTAWRAAARRRLELRALASLDRRLLRDVGLDESVPSRPAVTWHDLERVRW